MSAITDQIDTEFSSLLPQIQMAQAQFLAIYGHYFQGLNSCSVIPADGNPSNPDQWNNSPSYEGISYQQVWGNPPSMTSNIRCDQYVGPYGAGWTLVMQVYQSGVLWQRCHHQGPPEEGWREMPWLALEQVD